MILTLSDLLHPVDPKRFLREQFAREAVYGEGKPQRFSHLLSWSHINTIVSQHRTGGPQIRLAKNGRIYAPEEYSHLTITPDGQVSRLDLSAVRKELLSGATLVIDRIDKAHPPLSSLCRTLEYELGSDVFVDSFASWNRTQGFPTHWDVEQLFILQIVGRKRWRLFKPERLHPVWEDKKRYKDAPAAPCWEGELKPGDFLHIPGGWWHDATPVGEPSLHVAVSMIPPTGMQLLRQLLDKLVENEIMRAPLPRFGSEIEQQMYEAKVRDMLITSAKGISLSSYLEIADAVASGRDRLSLPWSADGNAHEVPPAAWLHWVPPRVVPLRKSAETVSFDALGSTFTFSSAAAHVLDTLMTKRRIQYSDLCTSFPDADIGGFVTRLVQSGLISMTNQFEL